jgi:predicted double-glycine peptidase
MRDIRLRHQIFASLAAILTWSMMAAGATAQPAADQPAADQQPREPERDSREEGPQTIQEQLAALKRTQLREKPSGQRTPIRDADHQTQLRVRNYVELKRRNIVMQRRDYSCGAATLATICRYYWGDDVTEDMCLVALDLLLTDEEVEDRIKNGLAMSDLRRAAVKLGYQAVVGKLTFAKLTESKVPLIVGIQPEGHKHFVVYRGVDAQWVYVADPIRGNIRMPIWDFRKQWQENAALVIHKPGQKVKDTSPLSLREEDVRLGELNWYLIQTQQSRMPQNKQTQPP